VLQFLQAKGFIEAYVALESACGVKYTDGALPTAAVLEASLDMFGKYGGGRGAGGPKGSAEDVAAEEQMLKLERGACCTGPLDESSAAVVEGLSANVTSVAWVARRSDEFLALAATADKRLRLFGPDGSTLAECSDFSSPLLGLDVRAGGGGGTEDVEVMATAMGGEVSLLRLSEAADGGSWSFRLAQRFRDHTKHITAGRFSPGVAHDGQEDAVASAGNRFLTISRDHSARLYVRGSPQEEFTAAGVVRLPAEVTACCWLGSESFVLAARDDHNLLYWDVKGGSDGGPKERCKTNLNALGDNVVSFAVLALAASPNGKMVAACTDKSRIIVLQAFSPRQLRNLYGAIVEEYDTPSITFSLDGTFVYATSSLPVRAPKVGDEEEDVDERLARAKAMCGQVSIFELRTGEQVLQLPCHERAVRCMALHPHTEALVTGSFDRSVRYWG